MKVVCVRLSVLDSDVYTPVFHLSLFLLDYGIHGLWGCGIMGRGIFGAGWLFTYL